MTLTLVWITIVLSKPNFDVGANVLKFKTKDSHAIMTITCIFNPCSKGLIPPI